MKLEPLQKHYKEWQQMDKMFKFRWWSPVFLYRYYQTTKIVSKEARHIINTLPKPRIKP